MDKPKFQVISGLRFCRDEETGYYRNGTHQKLAHRYAWEQCCGAIPEGFHVHHIDRDRGNNDISNLLCLSAEDHKQLHIDEDETFQRRAQRAAWFKRRVMPKAKDWHRTEEGRAWHRQHVRNSLAKAWEPVDLNCSVCGARFQAIPRAGSRFCTNKCRAKYRRDSGLDNEVRSCVHCGKDFTCNRFKKTRYCGPTCANRAEPRLPQLRQPPT
jgi:hypothetical protein